MVRSDKKLNPEFVSSDEWNKDELSGNSGGEVERYKLPDGITARMSFSGSERNSVFTKSDQGSFVNISGLSGLDSPSDGRCVAVIDLDQDGLNDFLIANSNKPALSVYRNQIAELKPDHKFIAVKLVGGNQSNQPSTEFCSRDAIGSLIRVVADGQTQIREVRCGEGLATQNSQTNLFGLGSAEQVENIEVRWPSGRKSVEKNIEAGQLVVFFENPKMQESQHDFVVKPYRSSEDVQPVNVTNDATSDIAPQFPVDVAFDNPDNQLLVITAMATWCDSCKNHLPDLERIQQRFRGRVQVLALPIDKQDTQEKLDKYIGDYEPAYQLLSANDQMVQTFVEFVANQLGSADVPFSVIVSSDNAVLHTTQGLPTVSDLEKILKVRKSHVR